MMEQYLAIKDQYRDCILFYRMGDFYEMFFDDAVQGAKILDIALTKRGKNEGNDIPMCGVPFHACEAYLHKLVDYGCKVAICEQMESPEQAKKRGYKAVVKREVVRIITPGTLIEDALLDAKSANFLCSLTQIKNKLALAWIDISTGKFYCCNIVKETLASELTRLLPKELLLADKLFIDPEISEILRPYKAILSPQVQSMFDVNKTVDKLKMFYDIATIESFGKLSEPEISACGSLLEYIELTQKGILPRLEFPKQFTSSNYMQIDSSTRRNLEIAHTLAGDKKGSLLSIIDKTVTVAGARLQFSNITTPYAHATPINNKLDGVQFFFENIQISQEIRRYLKEIPDIERALSRICMGKGSPKDLVAIKNGLINARIIDEIIEFSNIQNKPNIITNLMANFGQHDDLISKLDCALKDEVGVLARDGGYVKNGYHDGLDEFRNLRDNGKRKIEELRDEYRQITGVNTLKISHNGVLGFFVEVTPANSSKITDEDFIHRQTLASAIRYTTGELRQLESDIINAKEDALKLEVMIFDELVKNIIARSSQIANVADIISNIDVLCANAVLANENNYTRPVIDDSHEFAIENGRHPVVEQFIKLESKADFISNDANLSQNQRLWLLTGPNMSGKSTFLRQNAIIALMAQSGFFVPANVAHIGAVDKLFSRVGASDDLAKGQSTFMIEMLETATILNQATSKSLVILDEIGRGTSTHDGLSIAWAVLEHIHDKIKCRSLFATHYHELTSLKASLESLYCGTVKVKEHDSEVIFMHEVIKGAADRSYGVHVAKLAGIPKNVLNRANEILHNLETEDIVSKKAKISQDMPLFFSKKPDNVQTKQSRVEIKVKNTDIDNLSPKDALSLLYELKDLL